VSSGASPSRRLIQSETSFTGLPRISSIRTSLAVPESARATFRTGGLPLPRRREFSLKFTPLVPVPSFRTNDALSQQADVA